MWRSAHTDTRAAAKTGMYNGMCILHTCILFQCWNFPLMGTLTPKFVTLFSHQPWVAFRSWHLYYNNTYLAMRIRNHRTKTGLVFPRLTVSTVVGWERRAAFFNRTLPSCILKFSVFLFILSQDVCWHNIYAVCMGTVPKLVLYEYSMDIEYNIII